MLKNSFILLISLVAAAALGEIIIRKFKPEYKEVIESKLGRHSYRIFSYPKNYKRTATNPDKKTSHEVWTNSFGLRQQRELTLEKPKGVTRIGIFGDSFVDNRQLAQQHSFSEILNKLLNQTEGSYEVLNFGVIGYGTDQSYLYYLDSGLKFDLDHVIFVHCHNDFRDNVADQLFEIDQSGNLKYIPQRIEKPFLDFFKQFHITYLILEALLHLDYEPSPLFEKGEYLSDTTITSEQERLNRRSLSDLEKLRANGTLLRSKETLDAIKLFSKIIESFKNKTLLHKQSFTVVLLPRFKDANTYVRNLLKDKGINTLDLYERAEASRQPLESLFFKNDMHWNEQGNEFAAENIFRYLKQKLLLPN